MSSLAIVHRRRLLVAVALLVVLSAVARVPWATAAVAERTHPAAVAPAAQDDGSCPAPGSGELNVGDAAAAPLYDYAVLVDVSGSMVGLYNNAYDPTKDIFATVKESITGYVGDLQPGSLVHVIPFGNPVDPGRVRTFGIENPAAPDGDEAAALAYIDGLAADNTETHITASVQYALDLLAGVRDDGREHIQTILLYTDGIGNGPGDEDADGNFIVDNLVGALSDYRREQPYLFVKYVSLGVEVPGGDALERAGVDVVDSAVGVPPVREVRLAVLPGDLGALAPGAPATNRLCAAAGDLGEGIAVRVNDDPADLPGDVQVAFRAGGNVLAADGIPLTYTLATLPASGSGPFTTHVEIGSDDPEIFFVPSRLPVTFTAAPAAPPVELRFGSFPDREIVRGGDETVEWALPIDLSAPDGGAIGLRTDRSRLDEILPSATLGVRVGAGAARESVTLDGNQGGVNLVLSAAAADLAALPDGRSEIPVDLLVDPRDADLSITGAGAVRNDDGGYTVAFAAPLAIRARPECTVEVAALPTQAVTEGDAAGPLRWEGYVDLGGSNGCAASVAIDDAALRQAIPGARAALAVDGEERTRVEAADEAIRADLVVSAPRAAVAAAGVGDLETFVELVVDPAGAVFSPPPGATDNEDGTVTIAVPVRATVAARPRARCVLPALDEQRVVLDGATEPGLEWTGQIACELGDGTSVTMDVTGADASAAFVAEDGAEARSLTVAPGDPAPSVVVRADRRDAQRLGEGPHTLPVAIRFRVSPEGAVLDVPGGAADAAGNVTATLAAPIENVPERVVAVGPIALAPDPVAITTRATGPDPLVWRGEIAVALRNGAEGTLAIDPEALPDGVSASFEVGGVGVASPAPLAGRQISIGLVVESTLAGAQALGPGDHALRIPVVLDAQGARVEGPCAVREADRCTLVAEAALAIATPPSARLKSPKFADQTVSAVPSGDDEVTFVAPVEYGLSDGATITVRVDDGALRRGFPGAEAVLVVDGQPVGAAVELAENDRRLEVEVTAPKAAFPDGGTFPLPVDLVAAGEGVYITVDGVDVEPGAEARASASAALTVTVPRVAIDRGAWSPERIDVASTGTGAEPRRWERVLTATGLEDGARPVVTLALDEGGPMADGATVRLYAGEVADGNELAAGGAERPATASFEPGRSRIVAVVEATEDRLRGLGLSDDHRVAGTLTIDPNGAQAEIAGEPEPVREPTEEAFALRAKVYEPFDPMPWLRGLGIAAAAAAALAAFVFLRPGLPANAGIMLDGDGNVAPLSGRGGTVGGPADTVDIGAIATVGEVKGRVAGRLTGAAKFVATQPVNVLGTAVPAGQSVNIDPGTPIAPVEDGNPFTYVRS